MRICELSTELEGYQEKCIVHANLPVPVVRLLNNTSGVNIQHVSCSDGREAIDINVLRSGINLDD